MARLVLLAALALACICSANAKVITIEWSPANITSPVGEAVNITVGDTLMWHWEGAHTVANITLNGTHDMGYGYPDVCNAPHSVLSLRSGYNYTFNHTGFYQFICSLPGHCQLYHQALNVTVMEPEGLMSPPMLSSPALSSPALMSPPMMQSPPMNMAMGRRFARKRHSRHSRRN